MKALTACLLNPGEALLQNFVHSRLILAPKGLLHLRHHRSKLVAFLSMCMKNSGDRKSERSNFHAQFARVVVAKLRRERLRNVFGAGLSSTATPPRIFTSFRMSRTVEAISVVSSPKFVEEALAPR